MSMHSADDLRFLRFPSDVVDQCRNTVLSVGRGGIQKEEFNLSGYPWAATGSGAMDARRLIAASLGTLHGLGWVLTLNTDVLPARLGPEWVSKVTEYSAGIQEIKFHGYRWATGGKETMRVRELLLTMLGVLEEEGWTVYASIDQNASGGDQNTSETDTWHLCRPKGWTPGHPVYYGR
ncbi:hypothetical protein N0V91_006759 [Didymella pomorum]|uniref:Uncharacterized protein n=1 Tax=Didymella pomorum TaxID=749634 RepID=A0A9W9D5X9_9PLEO|nr:hypothetical protein N0V91_006759 [Didymella pomorum]